MYFRLHTIYGTLRLVALLTDIYVVYYAKNLIISEDSNEKDITKNNEKKMEPNLKENVENNDIIQKKQFNDDSSNLPDNTKKQFVKFPTKKASITGSHHARNASRDFKHLSANGFITDDFRKSSSHIAGPIADL